jgi:hypothetical protein
VKAAIITDYQSAFLAMSANTASDDYYPFFSTPAECGKAEK